jgi:mycoredoxin
MMKKIIMYGTNWCPDCKRSKQVFSSVNVPYDWIDIEQDEVASAYVQKVNRGFKSVPTILFPDGSMLVEPDDATLLKKLETMK